MELQSLHLPTSNPTFCPLICNIFAGKPSIHAHFLRFANGNEYPLARKLELFRVRARQGSSGAIKFSSTAIEVWQENVASKDDNLVFVAGATGRVGSRAVRELLKLGFHVRAGVRSAQRAESLVQSVRQIKLDNETAAGMTQPEEKLEIVECDLEKRDQIEPALGSASVVLCCIGASEKEVFDITGPYRIDYLATKNLIDAATVAKVKQFILLTSLGTNKVGFPAAILNLFWGVLIWKRKAEEVLIASGLPYTIVRPGGMERPTDSYKLTHNITLAPEDTLFGGQVSNLQVAELMAFMAKNQSLSYCKVVEVIAETTAPLTPMEELLAKIPSKRDNLTQETTVRPESPPPKSMEVEAPTIPMKKEAPEEEAVEKDAESKLNPAPSKDPIPQVLNTVAEAEAVAPRGAKPSPLSPYPVYEDLKPPTSPSPAPPSGRQTPMVVVDAQPGTLDTQPGIMEATDGTATSKSATTPMQKTQRLSPYTAYEDLKPPSSASKSSPGIPKEEPLITPTMVDGTPNIVDGVVFGKASQDSSSCCSPFPMYEDLKPPTSPTPTAPSSSGIGKAFADGEPEFTTIGGNNATAETTEVKVETDVKSSAELKPRPLSPYTMYHDMKPPTTPMPCPKKH